jgi:type I restriction enzyme S subunit
MRQTFSAQGNGTNISNLNQGILSNLEVPLPPLPIQHKIAAILSAYDDLIENNTRRIEILEEMARSIYREWFVKFRFPGHEQVQMVDSELGPIPEGWEMGGIIDFGEVITGKTPSKAKPEYYGDYMPFIKTPSMHGNMFCIEVDEYLSKQGVASQRNKILPPNSLLVNCIGALAGSVSITITDSQTNQQINAVVLKNKEDREFLYFNLVDLKELIRQYGSNGATMINLNKSKFEALPAVHPERETLSAFHKLTFPQFELIKNLQIKNTKLRKTRDLLLPRLISGEIDVENLDINTGPIAA